ncbi:hypothetical protein KSP40_PGU012474 [Platanthera guangdongensis]|uniref:Uncharacterized protein n=1 Tax=Platanthera guangdongensis TaxID=2320717 RepID=A0ABR2MQV8_9ASPA
MELISQSQLTVERELKQELFLRAEELEKLVAIYKLKLCGDGTSSLNRRPNLLEKRHADVPEEQRGQFYDVYMNKREVKLREEWRSKGAVKEADMRAMMDSLDSTSSAMMSMRKVLSYISQNMFPRAAPSWIHVAGANSDLCRQTSSRMFTSRSSVASSTSQSSSTSTLNSAIIYSKSASTKMENTNPSKGTKNGAPVQRSIARCMSSSERTNLVKDIRFSRSPTLKKSPASVGVRKNFTLQNSRPDTSTPPVHTNPQRRISMASFEDNEDIQKQMCSNDSSISAYHRFEKSSKIAEIPNSRSSHVQNIFHSETSDFDSSVGSLPSGPTTENSHNMNQYLEGKTVRVRKKWGSVERPFPTVAPKGIDSFFKFGEKSEVMETHNDR